MSADDASASRAIGFVVAGLGLSAIDAHASLVHAGHFDELNPVLAPLLATPWAFAMVKLALTAFGLVWLARLPGRGAAIARAGAIAALVAIDAYWLAAG